MTTLQKAALQLFAFIIVFLGVWLGITQLKLTEVLSVEVKVSQLERSLGEFYMKLLNQSEDEILDKDIVCRIMDIKDKICTSNSIDAEDIKVHVFNSSDVNAYALPDKHLVINTALITFCENPEELAGVMAHEIAHIEKNHVMRKLSKEIGFAALSAMIGSGQAGAEGLRILSSTAYDRKMEEEADSFAVDYLQNSKIAPSRFADLMYRISLKESVLQKNLTLISTHPNTEKRAQSILEQSQKRDVAYEPLLADSVWTKLQLAIKEE